MVVGNCQNARRIWSSTPQIADYADDANYRRGDGGRQNYASHTAPLERKSHLETLL